MIRVAHLTVEVVEVKLASGYASCHQVPTDMAWLSASSLRQEKRAQTQTSRSGIRISSGRVGVFHVNGWGRKARRV